MMLISKKYILMLKNTSMVNILSFVLYGNIRGFNNIRGLNNLSTNQEQVTPRKNLVEDRQRFY